MVATVNVLHPLQMSKRTCKVVNWLGRTLALFSLLYDPFQRPFDGPRNKRRSLLRYVFTTRMIYCMGFNKAAVGPLAEKFRLCNYRGAIIGTSFLVGIKTKC